MRITVHYKDGTWGVHDAGSVEIELPRENKITVRELDDDVVVVHEDPRGDREALLSIMVATPSPSGKFPGAVAYPIAPPNVEGTSITRDVS